MIQDLTVDRARDGNLRKLLLNAILHTHDQEPTDNSGSLDCIAIPRMRICALCPNCMRMRPATWPRIPYSAKFSSRIIFAFFAEWSGTTKIRLR